MTEQNKSVGWVAGMLALARAYFGWGFLAGDYFQNTGPRETNCWVNSITQLPNLRVSLAPRFRTAFGSSGSSSSLSDAGALRSIGQPLAEREGYLDELRRVVVALSLRERLARTDQGQGGDGAASTCAVGLQ